MMSSTLMNDRAERHNGMFGQVVKKSIRKLSFKSTVIRPISKTTAHNNANSAPAKESVNDYDL